MIGIGFVLARPFLFRLDPETAHGITLKLLKTGVLPHPPSSDDRLQVNLWDLKFPNPLGLAAGFDKNAQAPEAAFTMGLGFCEVGTVTPRPQAGNARPRLFRLAEDRAVINRMGFNNNGLEALAGRLARRHGSPGIVGVNIGANKDSGDRIADYVAGIHALAAHAAYFTINVSSPNTPGLRNLQAGEALRELLARSVEARDAQAQAGGRKVPLLLKVAPDLDDREIETIVAEAVAAPVEGLIVSNTTLSRDGLTASAGGEAGGLSGRPLFRRSTIVLAKFRLALGPAMPLIGVGGIDSGPAAWEKIAAGANLLQLYTGLVYEGPALVGRILTHLTGELERHGFAALAEAVGSSAPDWAAASLDDSAGGDC